MTEIQIMNKDDDESLFQFDTYEEFQRERLKLNHDNTLKLWSLLPSTLDGIDSQLCQRRTLQQQKKQYRSFKFFAFYSLILKKTFLKKKIRSRGTRPIVCPLRCTVRFLRRFSSVEQSVRHPTAETRLSVCCLSIFGHRHRPLSAKRKGL